MIQGVLILAMAAVTMHQLARTQADAFVSRSLAQTRVVKTFADATADPVALQQELDALVAAGHALRAQLRPVGAATQSGPDDGGVGVFRTVTATSGGGGASLLIEYDEAPVLADIAAIWRTGSLLALCLLVTGVVASVYLASSLRRSLDHVVQLARRLARNDPAAGNSPSSALAEVRLVEAALYEMRSEVERATRAAAEHQSILDSTPTGIMTISGDGQILTANLSVSEITGYEHGDLQGNMFHRLVVDHDRPAFRSMLTGSDGRSIQEIQLRHRQGHTITARIGFSEVLIHEERFFTLALQNMTDPRELATSQHWLSSDPLTGLPNRSALMKYLASSVEFCRRNGTVGAVLFMDFDRFKEVNDTLGHAAGDLFLQGAAVRFSETLRSQDFVARFAGDEFVVILNGLRKADDACAVAQSLLKAFAAPLQVGNKEMYAALSIGIGLFPEHGTSVEGLLHCADVAMYSAKQGGGDGFAVFSQDDSTVRVRKLQVETQLRRALDNGEFTLVYQPIFELEGMKLSRFEALLRWENPVLGTVSPEEFIPLCEVNGLIVDIGEWVLTTAFRQVCEWQQIYGVSKCISVNVSARQLAVKDVAARLASCVDLSGPNAPRVDLEITETSIMDVGPRSVAVMEDLRAAGFSLSIDDFGTGYSSLAYLSRFPVKCLKIDRSFVTDLGSCDQSGGIVAAVVAMGHGLGMKVVAEGIENNSQLDALRTMGCAYGQGYLLSRPLPAEAAGYLVAVEGAGIPLSAITAG
ncbi:MAG: EAL domain-containing protein [Pseudomonadota bacterium]|nr:EAL domain-containing protein [Pseudomonadota bacterium]